MAEIKCSKNIFYLFFKDLIYLFLERGEGRNRERNIDVSVASCTPPAGDLVYNPGMCPRWELNQQRFGSQAGTQSTEPGQDFFKKILFIYF